MSATQCLHLSFAPGWWRGKRWNIRKRNWSWKVTDLCWSCLSECLSIHFGSKEKIRLFHLHHWLCLCPLFCLPQIIQYQTVRYDTLPLSPVSRNRLSKFPRLFTSVFFAVLSIRGACNHTDGCNVASVVSKSVNRFIYFIFKEYLILCV